MSRYLLSDLLRTKWGFKGYVVGDTNTVNVKEDFYAISSDALDAVHARHGLPLPDRGSSDAAAAVRDLPSAEGVLLALDAGVDVESSAPKAKATNYFAEQLPSLVRSGFLPKALLRRAVRRTLRLRFHAGLFDPPMEQPLARVVAIPATMENEAREVSQQSFVLLLNTRPTHGRASDDDTDDGNGALPSPALPLRKGAKNLIAGPWAFDRGIAAKRRYPMMQRVCVASCVARRAASSPACIPTSEALATVSPFSLMPPAPSSLLLLQLRGYDGRCGHRR